MLLTGCLMVLTFSLLSPSSDRDPMDDRKAKYFLTPHKKRNITTALGVLEYLRLQGKSRKELEILAEHLEVNKTKFLRLYNDYYQKPWSGKKVKLEENLEFKEETDKVKKDFQETV